MRTSSPREWWAEWLGAARDPDGTWELGDVRPHTGHGPPGELQQLTLRSFGSELVAQLYRPTGAAPGALVLLPFYETTSVLGSGSARTRGRDPWAQAHALHLGSSGLSVLAVPWWFEQVAAADPRTAAATSLDERYRPAAELHHRTQRMTALGRSVGDLVLAVDAALATGLAEPGRLGAFGHSLGAKLALHLTALDPRVDAAAVHEPGLGLAHSNWGDPWYLGTRVPRERDHDELLGLVAPRPFLLAGGGDSDGAHNRSLVERAGEHWPTGRAPDLLHHNGGHALPRHVMAAIGSWLADRLHPAAGG